MKDVFVVSDRNSRSEIKSPIWKGADTSHPHRFLFQHFTIGNHFVNASERSAANDGKRVIAHHDQEAQQLLVLVGEKFEQIMNLIKKSLTTGNRQNGKVNPYFLRCASCPF